MIQTQNALVIQEFIKALEPVIRRVVREELNVIVEQHAGIFHLDHESPLYSEMAELKERNKRGELEFMSHEEVWG